MGAARAGGLHPRDGRDREARSPARSSPTSSSSSSASSSKEARRRRTSTSSTPSGRACSAEHLLDLSRASARRWPSTSPRWWPTTGPGPAGGHAVPRQRGDPRVPYGPPSRIRLLRAARHLGRAGDDGARHTEGRAGQGASRLLGLRVAGSALRGSDLQRPRVAGLRGWRAHHRRRRDDLRQQPAHDPGLEPGRGAGSAPSLPRRSIGYRETESDGLWRAGKAAFLRSWPATYAASQSSMSTVQGRFDITFVPSGSAGRAVVLGENSLAVSRHSLHVDEALALVRYLSRRDVQLARSRTTSLTPTIPDLYDDPAVVKAHPYYTSLKEVLQGGALSRPAAASGPKYTEVSRAYSRAVHSVLTREQKAATAVASLERELRGSPAIPARASGGLPGTLGNRDLAAAEQGRVERKGAPAEEGDRRRHADHERRRSAPRRRRSASAPGAMPSTVRGPSAPPGPRPAGVIRPIRSRAPLSRREHGDRRRSQGPLTAGKAGRAVDDEGDRHAHAQHQEAERRATRSGTWRTVSARSGSFGRPVEATPAWATELETPPNPSIEVFASTTARVVTVATSGRPGNGAVWNATWPGTESSTSVPAPGRLQTRTLPPIRSARSRIPESPQWPSRPTRRTSGSIPHPSSRTRTRRPSRARSTATSIRLPPEWRNAFTSASRPIR